MDIKSVSSLLDHSTKNKEEPLNPFNRAALPALFLKRVSRHYGPKGAPVLWVGLQAKTEEQRYALAAMDICRSLDDIGNYTNPDWFMSLTVIQMQRLYIELADIWNHRATLTTADRLRIVPAPARAFKLPVSTVMIMKQKALRPLILETCQVLVTAAPNKSDRQLGGMYVLGSLALISADVGSAFPWLMEMFMPGVTREVDGKVKVLHPSVLAY